MTEVAAALRPLPFRRRHDVLVEPIASRREPRWHLKDPLALRYWEFGDEELFLWEQLDESISLRQWQQRFEQRFLPRRIQLAHLHDFLAMLHREGLVVTDARGQAETMLERRVLEEKGKRFQQLTSPLAIRFRGIDPDRFLTAVYPAVRPLFHPLACLAIVALILSAIMLVVLEWSAITFRLAESQSSFTLQNVLWIVVAIAGAKILHELGHAFTTKHFGGECHELGLMLLVFTPCLYCNVSDVWLVSGKWRRMAVSAAGIAVELVLASLAVWIWWFVAPGPVQSLAFSLMIVCSVGTLFLNGNPLLRYDGYYILSDFVEVPNLAHESSEQLGRVLMRAVFGADAGPPNKRLSKWLVVYAVASLAYRLGMLAVIALFLFRWLHAKGLDVAFYVLTVPMVVGTVVAGGKAWYRSLRRVELRPGRAFVGIVTVLALFGGLLMAPVPRYVHGLVVIEPANAPAVYVLSPGLMIESARYGDRVKKDDVLARLKNHEVEYEVLRLSAERDRLQKQCDILRQRQILSPGGFPNLAAKQLPVVEKSLEEVTLQLHERIADREKLVLRAPCDGVVLAPRPMIRDVSDHDQLPGWSRVPLKPSNLGCFLEAGVLICRVSRERQYEATVILDEASAGRLAVGQMAEIQLDELPSGCIRGTLRAISDMTTDEAPMELVQKNYVATNARGDALERFHRGSVTLADSLPVPFGATGRVRLRVESSAIAVRVYEALCGTFAFARRD